MQYSQSQPPINPTSPPSFPSSFQPSNTSYSNPQGTSYNLYSSSSSPLPPPQSFAQPQFGGSGNTWGTTSYSAGGGGGGGGGGNNLMQSHPTGASHNPPQFGAGGPGQFGSTGTGMNVSQTGGGGGGGGYGEKSKKVYLPGYLSGPTRSRSTPPRTGGDEETRSWDSPTSHSGSPARFGNQSLFGTTRDGTPSRSPKGDFTPPPRRQNRVELEDAPPVMSLGDMDTTSDSPSSSLAFKSATRPTSTPQSSTPTLSSSPPKPLLTSPTGHSITVFGFPTSSRPHVLNYFSELGEIISSIPSPSEGNWITITYAQPWSAARAVRKNGEVLGGVLMVGVKLVDDHDNSPIGGGGGAGGAGWTTTTNNGAGIVASGISTPSTKPPLSNVGKPIHLLGPESAFKATPPRRSFISSTTNGAGGGGGDPHKSLFAERNRVGLQQSGVEKGVLGKITGAVFGW